MLEFLHLLHVRICLLLLVPNTDHVDDVSEQMASCWKNKSIVTIQQYIRANVLHGLVKMMTFIMQFDAQTLNVTSGEVTFDGNCSSACIISIQTLSWPTF
jgi:hypothetical protein